MEIDELELSVRASNFLRQLNVFTVEALLSLSAKDLLKVKGMGKKTLNELREKLSSRGYLLKEDYLITDKETINLLVRIREDIGLFLERYPMFKKVEQEYEKKD